MVGDGVADMGGVVGGVVDRGVVGCNMVGGVVGSVVYNRGSVVGRGRLVVGRGSSIGGGIGRGGGVCGGRDICRGGGVCRGSRNFKVAESSERLLSISQGEESSETKHLLKHTVIQIMN